MIKNYIIKLNNENISSSDETIVFIHTIFIQQYTNVF